jgi:hypothetical protein
MWIINPTNPLQLSIFAAMHLIQLPDFLQQTIFICFCAIIAIQLFYYLYFFNRLVQYRAPEKKESQEYPVSVIICARDEAEILPVTCPASWCSNTHHA